MNFKLNWDALGIGTSLACAIHCAILPIIVSSLPIFGINIIHNVFFEWSMIFLAFAVGIYSLIHGFIKHHRAMTALFIFIIGFSFLVLKQFYAEAEYLLLAIAVVLIISAHYYNYRLCHLSKCSSPHHKH